MGKKVTLLKELVRQRHLKYESFCAEYEKTALEVAPEDIAPSKAQYYRWLSSQIKGGLPYPDACRVLERMFPPWTVADLFGPYEPEQRLLVSGEPSGPFGSLLDSIPPSFTADILQGAWVTSYQFSHAGTPQCHADIAHITAESDRRIRATNHPPVPRTEGRAFPFHNEIEAQLVNRHLTGHWKNTSDTRYFGSLHLAILPGEMVMDGYYTGFASDIEVSVNRWRWIRLDAKVSVDDITLREPSALYEYVMNHSQYDAPATLADIQEGA